MNPQAEISRAQFFTIFLAIAMPMFMASVDQTLLATATPSIAAELGDLRSASWIAVGYLLASAVVGPVYGRLADARGRRDLMLVALVVFAAGSLACALAQSLTQLIAARVLQGLGSGGLMTLAHSLLGELVSGKQRVRFQAYISGIFTTANAGGPVIGGLLVTFADWRWIFYGYLPLCAFAFWRVARLPRSAKHPEAGGLRDGGGLVLFSVVTATSLYWLTAVGHRFRFASPESMALATVAVGSTVALFWHERRQASPFFPLELLCDRVIGRCVLATALFSMCSFAVVFFLPIYLQLGYGASASLSGMLLLPLMLGTIVGATITGRVVGRSGRPNALPVWGLSLAASMLLILGLAPANRALVILLGFFAGVGFGPVMPVMQTVTQAAAGRAKLGAVTSMVTLFRACGGAVGTAVVGSAVYALLPDVDLRQMAATASLGDAMVARAFHAAFLLAAIFAAAAAFAVSRMPTVTLE
jgi:EmrB/QacA subfamily drug resistance transporter